MQTKALVVATFLAAALPGPGIAQTTTGSTGCATITQAAANGATARVSADDTDIAQPQTIKNLTCLNSFFNGTGLNVITNLLNPTQLLQSIEGQLCAALTSTWKSLLGTQQCGITLTGFKIGFLGGNLGSGLSCPKLTFGGGGPPIGYIGIGNGNSGKLYVNGAASPPTSYPLPQISGLW